MTMYSALRIKKIVNFIVIDVMLDVDMNCHLITASFYHQMLKWHSVVTAFTILVLQLQIKNFMLRQRNETEKHLLQ